METSAHLFFSCLVSWQIWTTLLNWWGLTCKIHENVVSNIELCNGLLQGCSKKSFKWKLWISILFVTVWTIWYEKNHIKFQNKSSIVETMINDIKLRSIFWIKIHSPMFPCPVLQSAHQVQEIWIDQASKGVLLCASIIQQPKCSSETKFTPVNLWWFRVNQDCYWKIHRPYSKSREQNKDVVGSLTLTNQDLFPSHRQPFFMHWKCNYGGSL